ncbi:N-acetylmuramoyl-L-alanine amidase [bacterium]|nr:N-acetylmuramoyl-L-alanine amidase [FCB group bacterium]MBL7191028.1 N-acetylmuramoyl-L-alanine amidase [bacterium]
MKRLYLIILIVSLPCAVSAGIILDVVFPRIDSDGNPPVLPKVDSVFVFGSVNPAMIPVTVDGFPAAVFPSGAFIAYLPFDYNIGYFIIEAALLNESVSVILPYKIPEPTIYTSEILTDSTGCLLMVIDPHAVMRYSPFAGVYYMFPDSGTTVWSHVKMGNFYGIRLNDAHEVWIEDKFATVVPDGQLPRIERIYKAYIEENQSESRLIVPCRSYPAVKVEEFDNPSGIRLRLYGIESHLDRVRYSGDYIKRVDWKQEDAQTMLIDVIVKSPRLWGYKPEITEGGFVLHVKHPPDIPKIKGLKIAVDAGHGGGEFGAVGPTRLLEKDVNLDIAKKLADLLRKNGAEVLMIREDDSTVDLYRRVDIAEAWGADIFISVHNNALPEGINPFLNHGTGVHFYHPHSADLARCIHRSLVKELKLQDDGLYYHDLAVARASGMLSVLVEAAFIMHPQEEAMLREDDFRKKTAYAVFKGIENFFNIVKKEN